LNKLFIVTCALACSSATSPIFANEHINEIISRAHPILIDSINISHVDDYQRGKVDALISYCSTTLNADLHSKIQRIYSKKITNKTEYIRGKTEQYITIKKADLYARSLITMQCNAIQDELDDIKSG